MRIEVSKNELAGALSALGKLVCRTSPMEVYRSLRIEGKENQILFRTAGVNEAITFTLPEDGVEEFAVVVNFDEFRTVVRYGRSKSVELVYEDRAVRGRQLPDAQTERRMAGRAARGRRV